MTIPYFPTLPGLAYPVVRTPLWSTLPQDSVSGVSAPVALWSYPRWRWQLNFDQGNGGFLRSATGTTEFQTLVGFFNLMQGSYGVFRYTDPDDGSVTAQPFGTGDGATTTFQLLRTFGGFIEPVWSPSGSPVVMVSGSVTSVSIGTSGLVTFGSAPASGAPLTWTGTFDWLCRFDDDSNDFQKFMNQRWSQGGIKFTSIKLPPSS